MLARFDHPKTLRSRRPKRNGATTVEFAMVCPVIFALFFGAVELARMNYIRHTAANAAYEGARAAVIPGSDADDATETAMRLLNIADAGNGANVAFADETDRVTVTITIPLDQNSWGITRLTGGINIVQACTLSREL